MEFVHGVSAGDAVVLGGHCVLSQDVLGCGSFSVVFRATLGGSRDCACKVYSLQEVEESQSLMRDQYEAEVAMLQSFDSTTPVVSLLANSIEPDGRCCLALELGLRTLEEHMAAQSQPLLPYDQQRLDEVHSIGSQLTSALAFLEHRQLLLLGHRVALWNSFRSPVVADRQHDRRRERADGDHRRDVPW